MLIRASLFLFELFLILLLSESLFEGAREKESYEHYSHENDEIKEYGAGERALSLCLEEGCDSVRVDSGEGGEAASGDRHNGKHEALEYAQTLLLLYPHDEHGNVERVNGYDGMTL